MKYTIKICPTCDAVYEIGGKRVKEIHGLVLNYGGSIGGWGRRFYKIEISDEVCGECFIIIQDKMDNIQNILKLRRGLNRPNVRIDENYDNTKKETKTVNKIIKFLKGE